MPQVPGGTSVDDAHEPHNEQSALSTEALSKQARSSTFDATSQAATCSGGSASNNESSSNQDSTSKKTASSKDSSESKDGSSKDDSSFKDESFGKEYSSRDGSQKDDLSKSGELWRDESENSGSDCKDEVFSSTQQDSASLAESSNMPASPRYLQGGTEDARLLDADPVLVEWQPDAGDIWDDVETEDFQSLLVMNINQRTTVPQFVQFLASLGYQLSLDCVYMVHVPCSRKKPRARGFAVVHCATKAVAARLREHLDGQRFPGHRVFRVQVADRMSCVQVHEALQNRSFPPGYEPALAQGSTVTH